MDKDKDSSRLQQLRGAVKKQPDGTNSAELSRSSSARLHRRCFMDPGRSSPTGLGRTIPVEETSTPSYFSLDSARPVSCLPFWISCSWGLRALLYGKRP